MKRLRSRRSGWNGSSKMRKVLNNYKWNFSVILTTLLWGILLFFVVNVYDSYADLNILLTFAIINVVLILFLEFKNLKKLNGVFWLFIYLMPSLIIFAFYWFITLIDNS